MKLTYRNIQSVLRECQFNPKDRSPMSVILDINDASYYRNRAIELIKSADLADNYEDSVEPLRKAIKLLAVSILLKMPESNERPKDETHQT
jgi:hypothetical protein